MIDLEGGKEKNADESKFEEEKQSTVDQHIQELAAAHHTIAMM